MMNETDLQTEIAGLREEIAVLRGQLHAASVAANNNFAKIMDSIGAIIAWRAMETNERN